MLRCLHHEAQIWCFFEKFKEFEKATTNECNLTVSKLKIDNGGEYLSQEFQEYLKSNGIQHELTVPNSPEQNGVAERMNRTLVESARAMISHASLQNSYWAEAVATATGWNDHLSIVICTRKVVKIWCLAPHNISINCKCMEMLEYELPKIVQQCKYVHYTFHLWSWL